MCYSLRFSFPYITYLLPIFLQIYGENAFAQNSAREVLSLNQGWKFYRYAFAEKADPLIYDVRPETIDTRDDKPADSKPTEAVKVAVTRSILKPWILPSGNDFIKDRSKRYGRPQGSPGQDFPLVKPGFDDSQWKDVDLPHDWAINGPFYKGWNTEIGGGMGRLPVQGVAWYRRKIDVPATDRGRSVFLDIEGAMSYAMVWLNGKLVGGWPFGYSSFRLDLTPYVQPGGINQLAIRLDNPASSSRWYPGAGIYRNVWLVKTNPVHVSQWGTSVNSREVSSKSATLNVEIAVDNDSDVKAEASALTEIYLLDANGKRSGKALARLETGSLKIAERSTDTIKGNVTIANPLLWGPPPNQTPNRYVALTKIFNGSTVLDVYETAFGIRDVRADPGKGLFINGEKVIIKGVNQHHDLGALGAAFNLRAAKRQLDMLKEMGCNAIRMSHNPPSPELLDLTDKMGFLVIDEVFDSWERKKTPLDFHLIFPEWHEQDLRAMIRRDRNHPSVIMWSFGNEVGEQYTGEEGASVAKRLYRIAKDEDAARPLTLAMNYAKPDMPLPAVSDVIGLNYQGEGIRWGGVYSGLKGISGPPMFPAFHTKFPDKMILSSENASTLSSRGEYLFPVTRENSAPVKDGQGGDSKIQQVSAYELYSVEFGSSPDKVFATTDKHPFVAGGFVWTGWDYLGEPTPYYGARSSYSGIIDLAGFKKDRFYLYQSYWRPDFPMAHILPHWNWTGREGQVTPVHVFTSGDEAELFLNGKTLGRKKKAPFEYRLRWDDVTYTPGELKVVTYKNGKEWAGDVVRTTGEASKIGLAADRPGIIADGKDLSFITVSIQDKNGQTVPNAKNDIMFSIEGPAEIVATDNGDASNLVSFASARRQAFNGLCLVIVRAKRGQSGTIRLIGESPGLKKGIVILKVASE